MHYLYAKSSEYYKFQNQNKKTIPMSISGVECLKFLRLDDYIIYKQENEANFTIIDDDDDRVSGYWEFIKRMEQSDRDDADRYRESIRGQHRRDR